MHTLILSFSSRHGVFIHSIPGFPNFELADAAGKEWKREQDYHCNASYIVAQMA